MSLFYEQVLLLLLGGVVLHFVVQAGITRFYKLRNQFFRDLEGPTHTKGVNR